MTNNEIVEIVYRKYNVNKLIKKMIAESAIDSSCDDLEQYIYEKLLLMNNLFLNEMFNNNKLRNYISQIILRQRNGGVKFSYHYKPINTHYTKMFKLREHFIIDRYDTFIFKESVEYDESYDVKYELAKTLLTKFRSWWSLTGLTRDEEKLALGADLITMYFSREKTMDELASSYGVCRQTIYHNLAFLKKTIRDEYYNLNDTK
jgi:hypothetical protein